MGKRRIAVLAAGFVLDSIIGDPQGWPHPVRLIGWQIAREEQAIRKVIAAHVPQGQKAAASQAQAERAGGIALAASVALTAPLAAAGLLRLCNRVHPVLGFAAESILACQLLAAKSLRDESMIVARRLEADDLDGARMAVGSIVGRDTDALDEAGVARAAVETVAENTSDGVVAPLLFLGAGGVPAACLYKAVNTLDSMVGYENERYRNLGWASAKLDDVLNFVPARVSGALMCAAAGLCGMDARRAWRTFRRDRLNHTSPNSAHTEAACAGALGVQLGGVASYGGKRVEKPAIGDNLRPLETADIARANRLMYATAALALGVAAIVGGVRNGRAHGKRNR